jgi:hypothetical protein
MFSIHEKMKKKEEKNKKVKNKKNTTKNIFLVQYFTYKF